MRKSLEASVLLDLALKMSENPDDLASSLIFGEYLHKVCGLDRIAFWRLEARGTRESDVLIQTYRQVFDSNGGEKTRVEIWPEQLGSKLSQEETPLALPPTHEAVKTLLPDSAADSDALVWFLGDWGIMALQPALPPEVICQLEPIVAHFSGCLTHMVEFSRALEEAGRRRKADEELRQAEARSRALLDAIPDLMFQISADGRFQSYHTHRPEELIVAPSEFLGKHVTEVLPPEWSKELVDRMERAKRGEGVQIHEYDMEGPDGPLSYEGRITATEQGDFLVLVRNVTAERRAEKALKRETTRLSSLIKNLQQGIAVEDENRKIVYANDELCRVFQVDRTSESIVGTNSAEEARDAKELFADPEGFLEELEKRLQERKIVVGEEIPLADGRKLERDYIPIELDGVGLGHLWAYRDVTERKNTEERLRLLSSVAEASLNGIVITDAEERTLYINPAFEKISGYSLEEMEGKKPGALLQGPDTDPEIRTKIRNAIKNAEPVSVEFVNYSKDGKPYWIELAITPVFNDEHEVTHYVAVENDVTRRKKAVQELEESHAKLRDAREREFEMASAIQESLLLQDPPSEIAGFKVRGFSIASEGADGDFYDFHTLGDRVLDVLVGDVMGKGLSAALVGAAFKSQVSRVITTLATRDSRGELPKPNMIIQSVHDLVTPQLMRIDSFVTACYARVDMQNRALTYVNCGHTRTLHIRPAMGEVRFLEGKNVPLGFRLGEIYESIEVDLEGGDILLFYSDGVTEFVRNDKPLGEDGLRRLVEEVTSDRSMQPLDILEQRFRDLVGVLPPKDDVTCVMVQIPDPSQIREIDRLELPSDLEHLSKAREFTKNFILNSGVPVSQKKLESFVLAANEAFSNIVNHAHKGRHIERITLLGEANHGELRLRFVYRGEPFDRSLVPKPQLDGTEEGGYGLFIIDSSVDAVAYEQDPSGIMILTLAVRSEG